MATEKSHPTRKSPRLKDFDYAEDGAYFVTICCHEMRHYFGHVDKNGEMQCNQLGKVVWACWEDLPNHYSNMELDLFVVMPNHIHGIILINNTPPETYVVEEGLRPSSTLPPTKKHGIPEFVRALKSFSSRRINELRGTKTPPIWQRTFWDSIMQNEARLNQARHYIHNNPAQWREDRYYSES